MQPRILVITHTYPLPDLDGASLRILRLMQMMRELGWDVTNLSAGRAFHPTYAARTDEARTLLHANGIQAVGPVDLLTYVESCGGAFDAILLAVVPGSAELVQRLRQAAPRARVIFDTIELTFVSMYRAAQLRRSDRLLQQGRSVQNSQLQLAAAADFTLVVTAEEAELLQRLCPTACIHVISNVHSIAEAPYTPEGRRDLIFVGNFVHMPNRDAAQHFIADIWPRVRPHLPDAVVRLVGLPIAEIEALAAPDVLVTGHLPDLTPFYSRSRMAIAPLRFGAGIKGKVLEAMGNGLPVVMTPIAAEGTYARPGADALIAATPAAFAESIVQLAGDDLLWQRLAQNGRRLVEEHFSYAAIKTRLAALLDDVLQ